MDYYYYGKLVFPSLNAVIYNILSIGPNNFGTEPFYYYFANGIVNIGMPFVFCTIGCIPLIILNGRKILRDKLFRMAFSQILLYLFIFSIQAHKEERFLLPIYPWICLFASVSFYHYKIYLSSAKQNIFISLLLLSTALIGLSRILGLIHYYRGPYKVYANISSSIKEDAPYLVCTGSDWYRFPSHFMIEDERFMLGFIKASKQDNFGLLPKYFRENAFNRALFNTEPVLSMNNINDEENSHFVWLKINFNTFSITDQNK